jgi:AbrB family looped-hinge helix DNA binding protein
MAITLTVTAKGQITLRREVREHLGARQGDTVDVDLLPDGKVLLRTTPAAPISSLFGILAKPGTPRRSIEELNEAAAAGWAGEE